MTCCLCILLCSGITSWMGGCKRRRRRMPSGAILLAERMMQSEQAAQSSAHSLTSSSFFFHAIPTFPSEGRVSSSLGTLSHLFGSAFSHLFNILLFSLR
ncbi:hypothetical protein BX070DRAFT_217943 [Coemansia spiralis]|nr:hypothetical protein BX070DRAFT_217943 [Coemansia spiralis]